MILWGRTSKVVDAAEERECVFVFDAFGDHVGAGLAREGRHRHQHGAGAVGAALEVPAGQTPAVVREPLEAVGQALRFRQRRERLERGVLDLPNPFAGEAQGSADLF